MNKEIKAQEIERFLDDDAYYGDTKYVSCSMLKQIIKSPKHLKEYLERGSESSPALVFGNAFHTLLLEPGKFNEKFYIFDPNLRPEKEKNMSSKINKAWKAEELSHAEQAGKMLLSEKDVELMDSMINSLTRHSEINSILRESKYEQPNVWVDQETGILCKGKFDLVGFDFVGDVKTASEVDNVDKFRYDCYKYGYDMQAAYYADSMGLDQFKFIVVEKKPPFKCAVFTCSEEFLARGRERYRKALDLYNEYFVSCDSKINNYLEQGEL